jgi:hypothetical protein
VEKEEREERDEQLETLVTDVIPVVNVLRILHREQDATSHVGDVDRLRAKVEVVDGNMSEYDGGENLKSFLRCRSSGRPSSSWPVRLANDLDAMTDVVERLLLRLNGDRNARFSLEVVHLFDVDREGGAVVVVVSADELDDFASRDDAESAEDDRDGDVFVDRVVLEVDLAVLGEDVGLGLALESGPMKVYNHRISNKKGRG